MERVITTNGTKALFIDELDLSAKKPKEIMKCLSNILELVWISPNAFFQNENIHDFTTIHLQQNLRNTKDIVLEAKRFLDDKLTPYKEQLHWPPPIFPQGRCPIYTDSIEDALKKARELTNEGILVIDKSFTEKYNEYVKGPNGEWIKQEMNTTQFCPYEHLLKGGILVAHRTQIAGFEWPTIIVDVKSGSLLRNFPNFHECNFCMRCKANLFVVKDEIPQHT